MAEVLVRVRNTLEASHLSPLFDSLTGLPARVLFLAMLQNALHRTEVYRRSVALLLLDLDRFRNVNVPLGFRLGDEMLRQVAHRLGQCRTAHHILARTGGDEFAFIVPRLESRDSVLALADKALEVIRQPIQLEEHEVRACASMGIAFYPDDGVTAETLMTCAERALYRAKEEGRDTFRVFSD
ncbi:MAG TPA: GGDEF domain-containing protein [Pseudoduganella sp.]